MLIHDHSERATGITAHPSGAIAPAAFQSQPPIGLTTGELVAIASGWLFLGLVIGWSLNQTRVRRARRERDRAERRLGRAHKRCDAAKEVIARMVTEESEGRRQRPAVA